VKVVVATTLHQKKKKRFDFSAGSIRDHYLHYRQVLECGVNDSLRALPPSTRCSTPPSPAVKRRGQPPPSSLVPKATGSLTVTRVQSYPAGESCLSHE
jgi:hypothetical protein